MSHPRQPLTANDRPALDRYRIAVDIGEALFTRLLREEQTSDRNRSQIVRRALKRYFGLKRRAG